MFGFQAAGAAPIVLGHPVENPETIATAIRIGNPAVLVRRPRRPPAESGGAIDAVTDDEILAAYRFLAEEESVFCEAASAASVAGLLKVGVPAGSTVVCVLTGHGLKDPDLAISQISVPRRSTPTSAPSWSRRLSGGAASRPRAAPSGLAGAGVSTAVPDVAEQVPLTEWSAM